MEHATIHHRVPRAGIDAIDDAERALATIAMVVDRPLQPETIVLLLDEARRGRAIVVVSGTESPDAVLEVVECVTHGRGCEELGAIVVGTVRPHDVAGDRHADDPLDAGELGADSELGDDPVTDADPVDPVDDADIDRWLEMSGIAEAAGVELLEWFVIGRSISCPRDRLGEAPRW